MDRTESSEPIVTEDEQIEPANFMEVELNISRLREVFFVTDGSSVSIEAVVLDGDRIRYCMRIVMGTEQARTMVESIGDLLRDEDRRGIPTDAPANRGRPPQMTG